ncbi:hypothetical protein N2152v2_006991 [Parachlorella kessleri]
MSQRGGQPAVALFCAGFLAATVLFSLLGWHGQLLGSEQSLPGLVEAPPAGDGVAAQASKEGEGSPPLPSPLPVPRKRVLAVVGVQTGFTTDPRPKYNYMKRRQQLRATWFPDSPAAIERLETEKRLVVRFVVGHPLKEAAMQQEADTYGGFWRLPVQEAYLSLANKTLMFLSEAARRYDAQYIVKVDDDVYLRLDRIPHAISQWRDIHADYVGCMKTGTVIKSPQQRWYEPQHAIFGGSDSWYFTHAWGPIYVLSGRVAEYLAAQRPGSLRFFNNEDVTVGSWMLALNVTHFDDRRLCETSCSQSSLAVYDIPGCAGLCNPVRQLPLLHNSSQCRMPTLTRTGGLPLTDPLFYFDRRPDPRWEERALAAVKSERSRQAIALRKSEEDKRLRQQQGP